MWSPEHDEAHLGEVSPAVHRMNRPLAFDIHPDIRQAATLPAWVYADQGVFDAMR